MKTIVITLLAVVVALVAPGAEPVQLKDKPLVAWFALANLTQQGGSVLTIDSGGTARSTTTDDIT